MARSRDALSLALVLGLVVACGSSSNEAPRLEADSPGAPATAEGLRMQQDLLELAHLADVDHHGLFVDLGSPARHKYTVGNWGSGWGADGADGDITFTYVGDTGRVYFPLAAPHDLTLQFRMKPVGSRRMQLFLNGRSLEGVVLEEGARFRTYDVEVPAARTRAGDNYLLLRFGGTEPVDGVPVAVAMASIRVIEGEPTEGSPAPPAYDTLLSTVELGGVERPSLAVRAPTTLTYYLEVPQDGRLVFGVGGEGQADAARGARRARVTLVAEGGQERELFAAAVGPRWDDRSLDLGDFAGQAVRLELAAEGDATGRVAFSRPAVMVPPPEVRPRPPAPRNVIVLLIDTLRADRLRPYNRGSRVRTPTFDRLAEEGVLFEAAQSPENWTKPACASVLTGLTPITHGAKTSEARLPAEAELLSEALDEAGFATGSFIANGYVSDRFGFDQGWDSYRNFIRDGENTDAENVFRHAGDWIAAHKDERFFAYIQTIDPHVPYDPPGEYLAMYDRRDYQGQVDPRRTPELLEAAKRSSGGVTFSASDQRRLEALHDGEISYHDHHLGAFLERLEQLGVGDDTLLVITSDHGEEFNDHGSWGHGHSIFQELLGVPLLFHGRGIAPGRVGHTVSTLHVPQTVLDLLGLEGMARAEGRSLVPDLRGDVPVGPQVAFSDFQDIRRVIRAGRYKLVLRKNLSSVLFDLETDPGEEREREVHDLPVAGRYVRVLLGQYLGATDRGHWLSARQEVAAPLAAEAEELDDTLRDQLRALGYAN